MKCVPTGYSVGVDEHHFRHPCRRARRGRQGISDLNLRVTFHPFNAHKGPNLAGLDPSTGALIPLFHPRRDLWSEHFAEASSFIRSLTETGRVTVAVLGMNHPARIELRRLTGQD